MLQLEGRINNQILGVKGLTSVCKFSILFCMFNHQELLEFPNISLFSWLWCLNQGWYCLEKLDAYHSSVRCLSFLVKGLTIRMKHNVLTLLDMSNDREECYAKDESFINISSDTERDEYEWKMIRSGKPKGVGSRGVLVCLFVCFFSLFFKHKYSCNNKIACYNSSEGFLIYLCCKFPSLFRLYFKNKLFCFLKYIPPPPLHTWICLQE